MHDNLYDDKKIDFFLLENVFNDFLMKNMNLKVFLRDNSIDDWSG